MIHHILSFILGCFIILCTIFGTIWIVTVVDNYEKKVKDTKPYKIASYISNAFLLIICITFFIFLCWALGDSILIAIGG